MFEEKLFVLLFNRYGRTVCLLLSTVYFTVASRANYCAATLRLVTIVLKGITVADIRVL